MYLAFLCKMPSPSLLSTKGSRLETTIMLATEEASLLDLIGSDVEGAIFLLNEYCQSCQFICQKVAKKLHKMPKLEF